MNLFPESSITVVTIYLIVLQILSLMSVSVIAQLNGQRRLIAVTALLPTTLSAMTNEEGRSTNTYFQVFPMSVFLPSLLLLATVSVVWKRSLVRKLVLGCLALLAFINNPDFGLAAATAAMISVVLIGPTFRQGIQTLFATLTGMVIGGVVLWGVAGLIGVKPQLSYLVIFQTLFGTSGFMNEPMALGGLYVIYVTIFGTSLLVGTYALLRGRMSSDTRLTVAAVTILFCSIWSLLTTAYFAGRSYTSTAVGGLSFQLGLTLASIVLWLGLEGKGLIAEIRRSGGIGLALPVIGFVALSLIVMSFMRMPSPSTSMMAFWNRGSSFVETDFFGQERNNLKEKGVLSLDANDIGLLIPTSHSIFLQFGFESLLVSNHPSYSHVSPRIAKIQCERIATSGKRVIIEENLTLSVLDTPPCRNLLGSRRSTLYLSPSLRVIGLKAATN